MCAPTSLDYVPTLPNDFQVLPPSPEFGFDFVNAFASDDEEEPFEDLTDEEEEEPMPTYLRMPILRHYDTIIFSQSYSYSNILWPRHCN